MQSSAVQRILEFSLLFHYPVSRLTFEPVKFGPAESRSYVSEGRGGNDHGIVSSLLHLIILQTLILGLRCWTKILSAPMWLHKVGMNALIKATWLFSRMVKMDSRSAGRVKSLASDISVFDVLLLYPCIFAQCMS
jgi:hypothetical protein